MGTTSNADQIVAMLQQFRCIRDIAIDHSQPEETRLNDIYDLASEMLDRGATVRCVFEAYGGPRCTDRCKEPKDCNGLPSRTALSETEIAALCGGQKARNRQRGTP